MAFDGYTTSSGRHFSPLLIGFCILAIIFLIGGCSVYNNLAGASQDVDAAWGEVQNQYQRRADLIPNLVNTVKGYAKQEEKVLTEVVQARAAATQIHLDASQLDDPAALERFEQAQGELSGALGRLLAVSEAYPDLKSNQSFRDLQTQLEGTENRIAVARGRFNAAVRDYNGRVVTFPASILAGVFGFTKKPYFEATPGSEKAPQVEF